MAIHLISLFIKGLLIGLLITFSGLSGATAAFILGSYSQLLHALASLNLKAARYLFSGRLREFSEYINWKILLFIPLGIAVALFVIPQLLPLSTWKEAYKPLIFAGICGLVIGGLSFTLWSHRGGGLVGILLFFGGLSLSITLLILPLAPLPGGISWLSLHGMICAAIEMIPGIPAAVPSRLLADYQALSYYYQQGYWPAWIWFGMVFLLAALLLIYLMIFLMRRAQEQVLSLLMGLTAGVLLQLWPLRYMQSTSTQELSLIATSFTLGLAFMGILQFMQRRTLA